MSHPREEHWRLGQGQILLNTGVRVPEVSLTPPSQMLVREEALRPRWLAGEELDECCWTEVNMC